MAPDMVEMYADGLSTELASNGRHVVVWGLPHAVEPEVLDNEILRPSSFRFPPGEPYIFKLPRCVRSPLVFHSFSKRGPVQRRTVHVFFAIRRAHRVHFRGTSVSARDPHATI
jgi:hypothetical protein